MLLCFLIGGKEFIKKKPGIKKYFNYGLQLKKKPTGICKENFRAEKSCTGHF